MTLKRAKEIVALMSRYVFADMGIADAPTESLKDLSLNTLIQANQMVKRSNYMVANTTPHVDGKRTIIRHITIDDRLIAALYTATHYDPSRSQSIVVVGDRFLYNIHRKDVKIV
jgi:hypothetical protein